MDITQNVLYPILATGALGAIAYTYINSGRRSNRLPPPRINADGSRSSPYLAGEELVGKIFDDVTTLWQAFLRGHRESKDNRCLGTIDTSANKYNWLTYDEVYKQILTFGSGLNELVWSKQPSDTTQFVGAWMSNRVEFFVAEYAAFAFSKVIVPLYDTLGSEAVFHVVNQTEMQVIVCDKATRIDGLFETKQEVKNVKLIILTSAAGNVKDSTRSAAQAHGIQIITYEEVLAIGAQKQHKPQPPKPSDLALISYTSGTTGLPKGVMLTHEGCVACSSAATMHVIKIGIRWSSEEVHYSYLPMAHVYEQAMQFSCVMFGCVIGFSRGDPRKLFEDIAILKPTVFAAVPRILNRVYDMQEKYFANASFTARLSYQLSLRYKMYLLNKGIVSYNTWADKTTFHPVRRLFGGQLRAVICGSAPVARDVLLWYRCVLGIPVFEGYGQTETSAAATGTDPFDMEAGNVGVPFTCNKVKLVDVPDMNYFARDGKGEVCIKGLNCSIGYYREPQKTKELIDDDGWTHTGDIGMWQPDGNLKIIDRKKHIFKLAQGEYVAPEKIEAVYQQSSLIAQIFVDGCSLEICTVAIIIPDPDQLINLWKSKVKNSGSAVERNEADKMKLYADLCNDRAVRVAVLKEINELGKARGLTGFEQVKNVHLSPVPFTIENGLLTPTMKTKRPDVRKQFSDKINALYEEIRGVGELK